MLAPQPRGAVVHVDGTKAIPEPCDGRPSPGHTKAAPYESKCGEHQVGVKLSDVKLTDRCLCEPCGRHAA